jgi:DNA-binding NtrC family response regulator
MMETGNPRACTSLDMVIVDDDLDQANSLAMLLQQQGVSIEVANNAFAGLNLVRRHRPAVVMLDIAMPGMTGDEAALLVPRISPGTRVVLMSGYQESLVSSARKSLNVHAILEKPVPVAAIARFTRETSSETPSD